MFTSKELEEAGFNEKQMKHITEGLQDGLTDEQVKLYAKPEFKDSQMYVIREGLEHGLSNEQVKLFTKPEFDSYQMDQIRLGLEDGLSKEQLNLYAKPEFDDSQMLEIRWGFKNGLPVDQVKLYAKPELSTNQMESIRKGFENWIEKADQKPVKNTFTKDEHKIRHSKSFIEKVLKTKEYVDALNKMDENQQMKLDNLCKNIISEKALKKIDTYAEAYQVLRKDFIMAYDSPKQHNQKLRDMLNVKQEPVKDAFTLDLERRQAKSKRLER